MSDNEAKRCGVCANFDRYDATGHLISLDGRRGFCRVNNGLLLGERDEAIDCPPSQQTYFISLDTLAAESMPE
ncbi:hypothetical protein HY948_01830 [Candidatus Gottesmanbacteria bacterium]|nr:hypothetical protein [Candidatus Gottesmanbacteria bacterium]